jgi:photosystem II stability/assembly factor-like uncharacterized protein
VGATVAAGALALGVLGPSGAVTAAAAPGGALRANVRVTPEPVGIDNELFGISFADARNGHAVGTGETAMATADGGATWQRQQLPVHESDELVRSVSFPDPMHGHAVTLGGSLLVTSDGGATWQAQKAPPPLDLDGQKVQWTFPAVSFSDAQHGFVVGGRGAVLSTSDGGANWQVFSNPTFGNLMDVQAVTPTSGEAVGWSGQVQDGTPFVTIATVDGGRTWEPHAAQFKPGISSLNFNGVSFPDPLHGFAVGDGGRIVATSDGGRTWTLERSGSTENFGGVAFTDARRGVAVGTVTFTTGQQRAIVFATDDGGLTWVSRLVPDTARLRGGVDFADRSNAYAVGCRRDLPGVDPSKPTCAEAALVRIQFFGQAPSSSSNDSGLGLVWLVLASGIVLAALIVVGVVLRGRRVG